MRIALVHDYLREYGGAERVLECMREIWPGAPVYTSFVDWDGLGIHADRFRSWDIRTSWIQQNIIVRKLHSPLRFLARYVWESFDFSSFDVILSSSGWFICRGIRKRNALHISYIHHPPRNLYGYATGSSFQRHAIVRWYAFFVNFFLRQYDYETAQRVDYLIANSQETVRRIKKFYRRDSMVIYPPIHISPHSHRVTWQDREYYLCVGRLAYAKRVDIVIQACNNLSLPLKIVGTGKEEAPLRRIAGSTIAFLGSVPDDMLPEIYARAKALIFCAIDEDFGMVPVEAMAHGVPVIAFASGGVKETVIDGVTGLLVPDLSVDAFVQAIQKFERMSVDWENACRKRAKEFSKERFKNELSSFVEEAYNTWLSSKQPKKNRKKNANHD